VKKTRFHYLYSFVFVLSVFTSLPSEAFKELNLWLPVSYQAYYNRLLEASKIARSDPGCHELLKGELAEHLSSLDHPVFKFYCRGENLKTSSLLIDNKTLAVTNTLEDIKRRQALSKQRAINKEIIKKRKEIGQYWRICHDEFKSQTRLFEGLSLQTTFPPTPEISVMGEVVYTIFFEAKTLQRQKVRYQAIASTSSLRKCVVTIDPR